MKKALRKWLGVPEPLQYAAEPYTRFCSKDTRYEVVTTEFKRPWRLIAKYLRWYPKIDTVVSRGKFPTAAQAIHKARDLRNTGALFATVREVSTQTRELTGWS